MSEPSGKVSDGLERWLGGEGEKTVASLIELFEEKSFAILFVVLLGVPALPLPTGGATHVFEIIAILAIVSSDGNTRPRLTAKLKSTPSTSR